MLFDIEIPALNGSFQRLRAADQFIVNYAQQPQLFYLIRGWHLVIDNVGEFEQRL